MNIPSMTSARPQTSTQSSVLQAFRNHGSVVREFTAEQASDSIELRFPMTADRNALFLAQVAVDRAKGLLETCKAYDNSALDSNQSPGLVAVHAEESEVWYDECNVGKQRRSCESDLTPGAESMDCRSFITGPFGESDTASYYRNAGDCELVGFKGEYGSTVEVLIAPSGALTVFTDK